MEPRRILSFALALLVAGAAASFAESNPYQIDDALDKTIRTGLHELYDLNFVKAKEIYESVQDKAEEHPILAFELATVLWWRISVNVLENDPAESQSFLEAADRCIAISLAKIDSGDPTGEAHVALGSSYALLARWEAANRHWIGVYHREKTARLYLKKALQTNPDLADAQMALGIFDYTLANLSAFVRFISASHVSGDPAVGLAELEIAAGKGTYMRLPAVFLLATIYSEDLKQPYKTVDRLSRLRQEYPSSPFVDLMMFTALYNQECPVELSVEADDFEARIKSGAYRPEFSAQAHFFRALVHFKMREWRDAVESFDRSIAAASEKSPFKIWAALYKGYALDLLDERDAAVETYQSILNDRPRWKSHEYAKERLKHPFTEDAPQMKTLLL